MSCGPQVSVLTGLDLTTLQSWLTSAQMALLQLQTGAKVATVAYAQGDGSKSVSYTRAEIGSLTALIVQLQQALGIRGRRRAARFTYL